MKMKNKINLSVVVFLFVFVALLPSIAPAQSKKVELEATGFQNNEWARVEMINHYLQFQTKPIIFLDKQDTRVPDKTILVTASQWDGDRWKEQNAEKLKENRKREGASILIDLGQSLNNRFNKSREGRQVGNDIARKAEQSNNRAIRENERYYNRRHINFRVIIRFYENGQVTAYYADGFLVVEELSEPGSTRKVEQVVECSPVFCSNDESGIVKVGDPLTKVEFDLLKLAVFEEAAKQKNRYLGGKQ